MAKTKSIEIVIAPNSFKGSLTSMEAAKAIASGLKKSGLTCTIQIFPVADGGSDTMHLLSEKEGAEVIETYAEDPLGEQIVCEYGWLEPQKKAIIGLSEASGLQLLKGKQLQPLLANTFGTGVQIKHALSKGAKSVLIAVGGSATTDGGTGLLRALGLDFLDNSGKEIHNLPKGLPELNRVETSASFSTVKECDFIVLCDVKNKLLGEKGAAQIFGPQKGAAPSEVVFLEECLQKWNRITYELTGINMSETDFGGAAGGVSSALYAYLNAHCVSGIDYVLDTWNFDHVIRNAGLVITGEGKIDSQTLEGKAPYGVAIRAARQNIPVIAFVGQAHKDVHLNQLFSQIITINKSDDLAEEMKNTASNLQESALLLGERLKK